MYIENGDDNNEQGIYVIMGESKLKVCIWSIAFKMRETNDVEEG